MAAKAAALKGRGIVHHLKMCKDDGGRCHAEGDIVGQRVELLTNGRRHVQEARAHAIEEVERGTQDDKHQRHAHIALKGKARGDATRNEVARSKGVWNYFLNVCYNIHLKILLISNVYFKRAMTVWSPTVACPIFTHTSVPKGR